MQPIRVLVAVGLGCGVGCGSVSPANDAGGTRSDASTADAAGPADAAPRDGAPADAMIVPPTCDETPVCAYAGEIGSVADIVAVAEACATWGEAEIDSLRRRTPTFLVSQSFSVCPEDFSLPADCSSGTPLCRANLFISVDPELSGVDATAACSGAQFAAGSRFRARFHIEPPRFGNQFRVAHIQFERPCEAACVDGESRCDANQNCYLDSEVCFSCGRGTREECACRSPDNGILLDCTECRVRYDDAILISQCIDGTCGEVDPCETCTCN